MLTNISKRMAVLTVADLFQWSGAFAGLAGAELVARHSGWGFLLFLLSNALMLAYGRLARAWGLVMMQVGFTITSLHGISNWLCN